MSITADKYGLRQGGGAHGDVFTSPSVVRFMLDLSGYTSDKDLSEADILEPSCGEGEFLEEIQNRIIESSSRFGFDPEDTFNKHVYACELDGAKMERCVRRLRKRMPRLGRPVHFKNMDFLDSEWDKEFDFVIGNPPYIRYEQIPEADRGRYKSKFLSFHYRCDIYVLFYEHSLHYLKRDGRHCFICSNRWLRNEYGRILRGFITANYNLEYIIDVSAIDAFEKAVLAYPAVTMISNRDNSYAVKTAMITELTQLTREIDYREYIYGLGDELHEIFQKRNLKNFKTIEEQGFEIGIGVATGADRIFISTDWEDKIEEEILLPLISSRDIRHNNICWGGRKLLNPYEESGKLIDLDRYPGAKSYLDSHKEKLEKRHIVSKCNKGWYSLIDRIKPGLKSRPKILLPEMSGNNKILVDSGQYYPAHNMYYIIGNDSVHLKLLAAVLMSSFVKEQLEEVGMKMNGGYLRWQSQSIRRLRLPDISETPCFIERELVKAYDNSDLKSIDSLVEQWVSESVMALGVNKEKTSKKGRASRHVSGDLYAYGRLF